MTLMGNLHYSVSVGKGIYPPPKLKINRQWFWLWLFLIFYMVLVLFWSLQPGSYQAFGFLTMALTSTFFIIFFPAPVSFRARLLGLGLWLFNVYVMISILPHPPRVDARMYYSNMKALSASDLMKALVSALYLKTTLVYSPFTLPLVLKPLLGNFVSLGPWAVALPYGVLWTLSSFVWVKAVRGNKGEDQIFGVSRFTSLLFVAMMVLPSVAYWSMSFMKEIVFVAISVLSAVRLSQRKYISAILLLVVATLMRPYAAGIVASYWLFLQPSQRLRWVAALGSISLFFALAREHIISIAKLALLSTYMFISPDPTDPANWQLVSIDNFGSAIPTLFMTLEGLLLGTLFLVGIGFFIWGIKRRTWLRLGLSILIGCVVLAFVDYYYSVNRLGTYALFVFGAPAVRLKFALWPLIVTWSALALRVLIFGNVGRISEKKVYAN